MKRSAIRGRGVSLVDLTDNPPGTASPTPFHRCIALQAERGLPGDGGLEESSDVIVISD